MKTKEAIERVKARFDKWSLDEEDLAALQALGLVSIESEDERILNALITHISIYEGDFTTVGVTRLEMLAYLEKQKEQKSIEDVVKDITKNKETATKFLKSAGIMDDNGELAEMYRSEQKPAEQVQNNEKEPMEIKFAGKIYKVYGTKELPGGVVGYIIKDEPGHYDYIIHPDEVLGGYGIKSNGSPYPTKDIAFSEKPAEWNEIGYDLGREKGMDAGIEYVLNHLELYGLCKPAEWSEEDDYRIRWIIALLTTMREKGIDDRFGDSVPDDIPDMIAWLKSLPERFNLQAKQEWSEEEKGILLECISVLQNNSHWLLADRLSSLRPQPHWKPSKEQMKALWEVEDRMRSNKAFTLSNRLASLYNDLKKL